MTPPILVIPNTGKQASAAEIEQWRTLLNIEGFRKAVQIAIAKEGKKKTA